MEYRQWRPGAPLGSFVQTLWYAKGFDNVRRRERVFPSGAIQLVINLAKDRITDGRFPLGDHRHHLGPSVIVGVHAEYVVIDTADLAEMMGIVFRPGGFVPFFGIPAGEFQNAHIDLENVWGAEAHDVRDQLREGQTPEAKFQILERSLLERAQGKLARHPAVDFAIGRFQSGAASCGVDQVTQEIGFSRRHFAQLFRELVGVSPKLYSRILRFQRAVQQISQGREVNWADLALECGYFDQSHFANDFRAFSGITPGAYRLNRSEWMNHVPLEN